MNDSIRLAVLLVDVTIFFIKWLVFVGDITRALIG